MCQLANAKREKRSPSLKGFDFGHFGSWRRENEAIWRPLEREKMQLCLERGRECVCAHLFAC